jgi:uncharacterized membrane protein HdeD (DUF308 family)
MWSRVWGLGETVRDYLVAGVVLFILGLALFLYVPGFFSTVITVSGLGVAAVCGIILYTRSRASE